MGKLRRITQLEINGEKRTKLTVEFEIPRDDGQGDIKLGEFFFDPVKAKGLTEGTDITISVRPWVKGKDVAFSALAVLPPSGTHKAA